MTNKYFTAKELLNILRQKVQEKGSQKAVAEDIGISQQYLHDILLGRRDIGPATLQYLGVRKITLYKDPGENP